MSFLKKIIILCFCFLSLLSAAQENPKRKTKKVAKIKAQREQETLEKYQQALKQHRNNQSKDTRKRMKKKIKKAETRDTARRTFFLKKWFNSNKRKNNKA